MTLTIGNAQAFWGDNPDAAGRLAHQFPALDYLTLDYLSEVSLSILAIQKEHDPSKGYAKDFVDVVLSLIPGWDQGSRIKIISNAGGLNPVGCALACQEAIKRKGISRKIRIGVLTGDDVLSIFESSPGERSFRHLDSGLTLESVQSRLVTANAYLGAMGIVDALNSGADIVITGRVADPSLTVAPCVYHYKWSWDDYDKIAGATVAGHLIECGTQVTGGISTDWLELKDPLDIGFPIAEVHADGSCIITKAPGTGGVVNAWTVKEQLLYEIGDPANYLSPDVKVSFLNISVEDLGNNRVSVQGAKGSEPPFTLKVSATYRAGFKSEGLLTIFGDHAVQKARKAGEVIKDKLDKSGGAPALFHAEVIGAGACAPGCAGIDEDAIKECVLRIYVQDENPATVERFSKSIASLVTCGPPGVTGYTSGRPSIRPVFGYWPSLIDADRIRTTVSSYEVYPCPAS